MGVLFASGKFINTFYKCFCQIYSLPDIHPSELKPAVVGDKRRERKVMMLQKLQYFVLKTTMRAAQVRTMQNYKCYYTKLQTALQIITPTYR